MLYFSLSDCLTLYMDHVVFLLLLTLVFRTLVTKDSFSVWEMVFRQCIHWVSAVHSNNKSVLKSIHSFSQKY